MDSNKLSLIYPQCRAESAMWSLSWEWELGEASDIFAAVVPFIDPAALPHFSEVLMWAFFFFSSISAWPYSAKDLEELRLDLGVLLQHEPTSGTAFASGLQIWSLH